MRAGGGLNVADVFSVDLFGNSTSVVSGINADLFCLKSRAVSGNHLWFDKDRGVNQVISSNLTDAESTLANSLTAFNPDGYDVGSAVSTDNVGWSFKKAPKFFDVVAYTGDDIAGREIPHSLGVQAGLAIIKETSGAANWYVQHTNLGGTKFLNLDLTASAVTSSSPWNDTAMTDSNVTLGNSNSVNQLNDEYIMYVFADDTSPEGIIQCGEYVGNGSSTGPIIDLGWKPQYIMIKNATQVSGAAHWVIFDTTRGIVVGNDPTLKANSDAAEFTGADFLELTATGFQLKINDVQVNTSGETYIYMAIREE